MTKVKINYQPSATLLMQFMPYSGGKRLWIQDPSSNYSSVGWCPHISLGHGECNDCALVLEMQ